MIGPQFTGYEGETAMLAEGLVEGEGMRTLVGSRLSTGPLPVLESATGRAAFTQPVLMAPFYVVGLAADEVASGGDLYTYRSFLLRLYGAAITALGAALLFVLVRVLGRSEGWALAIGLMFAFASIAFPYASIGMEPTAATLVIAAFLAAAWVARTPRLWPWVLPSLLIGAAALTRPSNVAPALASLVLLWPALRQTSGRERWVRIALLAAPLVLGAAAILAYNEYRYGGPFKVGYRNVTDYSPMTALDAIVGMLISPGKGLLWYSPLVILGLAGLVPLWRRERTIAIAIIAALVLGIAPYATMIWGDEPWGPRYLVPVAGMLLVPIAWWATTKRRRQAVAAVAAVAVAVQLAGTLVSWTHHAAVLARGEQTGVKIYGHYFGVEVEEIPYGEDPVRWIPLLSPLLYHGEALVSIGTRTLGLGDLERTYNPFFGASATYDYSEVPLHVWWNPGAPFDVDIPPPPRYLLIPFVLLALGAGAGLYAVRAGRPHPAAPRST